MENKTKEGLLNIFLILGFMFGGVSALCFNVNGLEVGLLFFVLFLGCIISMFLIAMRVKKNGI